MKNAGRREPNVIPGFGITLGFTTFFLCAIVLLPLSALVLKAGGLDLEYTFDAQEENTGIPQLMARLNELGVGYRDLNTRQSTLEEIFVDLVTEREKAA